MRSYPSSGFKACLLALAALTGTSRGALAREEGASYYMIIFSSQTDPNLVKYSHTFATFVKVEEKKPARFALLDKGHACIMSERALVSETKAKPKNPGTSLDKHDVQSLTISWLPETLDIVTFRGQPETGWNFDLHATIRWAQALNANISMWGPYEIQKGLYDRASQQETRLRSRAIQYKVLDGDFRPQAASNCIHAVSDLFTEYGYLDTGTERGEIASQLVANHLKNWIVNTRAIHPWIGERLGLNQYPMTLRGVE